METDKPTFYKCCICKKDKQTTLRQCFIISDENYNTYYMCNTCVNLHKFEGFDKNEKWVRVEKENPNYEQMILLLQGKVKAINIITYICNKCNDIKNISDGINITVDNMNICNDCKIEKNIIKFICNKCNNIRNIYNGINITVDNMNICNDCYL
jgi:hypothetical protein